MCDRWKQTLLITTSRRPTQRIRTLSRDLYRVLPNSRRINRGKLSFERVVEEALTLGADRLMLLQRWKGAPGKIEFYVLEPSVQLYYPTIYLYSVRLQDELRGPEPVRGKLVARPTKEAPELEHLSRSLADYLRIPLILTEPDDKRSFIILVFGLEKSKATITFKNPFDVEIGPRLTVKHLIW